MKARAGRLEWWCIFFGANVGGSSAQNMLSGWILPENRGLTDAGLPQVIGLGMGVAAILALVLWIQRTVTVRRARDRDGASWPFWGYALVSVAFAVSGFVLAALGTETPFHPAWAWGALSAAILWMVIQFGLRPGDSKANRWGPAPKSLLEFSAPKVDNYRSPHL